MALTLMEASCKTQKCENDVRNMPTTPMQKARVRIKVRFSVVSAPSYFTSSLTTITHHILLGSYQHGELKT